MKLPPISRTIVSLVLSIIAAIFAHLGWDISLPSADVFVDGASLMTVLQYVFVIAGGIFRVLATKQTTALGVKTDQPLG